MKSEANPSLFRGENIVCFSTADWDTLLPTNKHHLMRRLAKRGARVLFIETFGTRAPKVTSAVDGGRILRRLKRGFSGATKREPRLWSYSPLVLPRWNTAAVRAANQASFRLAAARALSAFPNPIAWIYNPYAVYTLDVIKPKLIVYHMVDDLAAVPGADAAAIREAESLLLARADLVFCTERSLYDKARSVTEKAFFMPNVADYGHFRRTPEVSSPKLHALRQLPRPRIVFSGNLTPHKIDFPLLRAVAKQRPDYSFVLIGPEWEGAAKETVSDPKNVYRLGHIPYEELPAYLHEADVLTIPYRLNDATRAVFPLKIFEYLSVGKPVVASNLPSLLPYKGTIGIAGSIDDWCKELDAALRLPHESAKQRRALARRHTWEARLDEMEEKIQSVRRA